MRLALIPISFLIVASAGCGGTPLTLAAIAPAGTTDPLTCAEMEALLAGYDLERREGTADRLVAIRDRGAVTTDKDMLTMTINNIPQSAAAELRVAAAKLQESSSSTESIGPVSIGMSFGGGAKAPDARTEADARSIVSRCAGPPIEVADTVPEARSP